MGEIHYTSEDGLELFAKSYGNENGSKVFLCLHGLTRNHKDFEPMIEALLKRHDDVRFIAWDTRGRCNSQYDPAPENYALPNYASDVLKLLEATGVQTFGLIGTSMGGLISMVLRSMIPDRIKGVALNDIGPVIEIDGLRHISTYLGKNEPLPSMADAASALTANQAHVYPDYTLDDWLQFAERTWKTRPDGQVEPDYDPHIVDNFAVPDSVNEDDPVMWGLFNGLKGVPLLLIRGALSELLSAKTADRMISEHGDATLVTVPQVGHAPVLDEAEAIDALSAFIKKVG